MTDVLRASLSAVGLTLFSALLSFLAAWYWFQRHAAAERARVLAAEAAKWQQRVTEMEAQLALLKQAVQPISTAFQAILIKELTHFHTPEMDALLDKISPDTLTPDESVRLQELLEHRAVELDDRISESERDAAVMLPMVMKRARIESQTIATANALVQIKVVAVATPPAVGVTGEAPA